MSDQTGTAETPAPLGERFRGAILGLAIGDALGWPLEGTGHPVGRAQLGSAGVTGLLEPPLFTDDTQMSLALAGGLLEAGEQPLDDLMAAVVRQFVAWAESDANDRAPGATVMRAIARLRAGTPWRHAGIAGSKGCGTAMRTAPIGLYYHRDYERLKEVAVATSLATHGHPAALAGGVATAYLTSLALNRTAPAEMLPRLLEFTAGMSDEFTARLEQVPAALLEADVAAARRSLGRGWVAEEAVALALYCFLRAPEDYRAAVLTGANTEGDSDSVACIAGAISGAYNGENAIPSDWRRRIELSHYLAEIADSLHAAWQRRLAVHP